MKDYRDELNQPPAMPGTAATTTEVLVPTNEALIRRTKNGANWLYAVAALSAVNVFFTHLSSPVRFAVGLGLTDLIYAVGHQLGTGFALFALGADLGILGLVAALGYQARQFRTWAFVTGITLLVLDAAVMFWIAYKTDTSNLGGVIFRVLALAGLITGLRSARLYNTRKAERKA